MGVAAGRPVVAGGGAGVGDVVGIGGTVPDIGATGVGAALGPQARLSAVIAERMNISMDGFMAGFPNDFMVSFSTGRPREIGIDLGLLSSTLYKTCLKA